MAFAPARSELSLFVSTLCRREEIAKGGESNEGAKEGRSERVRAAAAVRATRHNHLGVAVIASQRLVIERVTCTLSENALSSSRGQN